MSFSLFCFVLVCLCSGLFFFAQTAWELGCTLFLPVCPTLALSRCPSLAAEPRGDEGVGKAEKPPLRALATLTGQHGGQTRVSDSAASNSDLYAAYPSDGMLLGRSTSGVPREVGAGALYVQVLRTLGTVYHVCTPQLSTSSGPSNAYTWCSTVSEVWQGFLEYPGGDMQTAPQAS